MEIKIRDILSLDTFQESKLIAGKSGLDKTVDNICVLDVTDIITEVEADSLLLTTLYAILNNENQINNMIEHMAKLGISGMGLKHNSNIGLIPAHFVEQANRIGFPIFILPEHSNFTHQINDYLRLRNDLYTSELEHRDKIHSLLLEIMLHGNNYDELLNGLTLTLKRRILFLDNNFNTLGESDSELFRNDELRKQIEGINPQSPRYLSLDEQYFFAYAVGDRRTEFGYIIVFLEEDSELSHSEQIAVEQFAVVFRIFQLRQRTLFEIERHYIDEFFFDLVALKINSEEEYRARANKLNLNLNYPLQLLVLNINNYSGAKKQRLLSSLNSRRELNVRDNLLATHDENFVILMQGQDKKNQHAITDALIDELTNQKFEIFHIGVSNFFSYVGGFAAAYNEAKLAIKIDEELNTRAPLFYNDLGINRVLYASSNSPEAYQFCIDTLGGILEYDRKTNSKLFETLKCLIECDGNVRKAADQMYIHYNTMRFRQKKLEQFLGKKLSGITAYQDAYIAIKLYESIFSNKIPLA